jgi:hypothetical protein
MILSVDHHRRVAGDDEEDLLLVAFHLVVLGNLAARLDLHEVDSERLTAECPAHERPAARPLELVAVGDDEPVLFGHAIPPLRQGRPAGVNLSLGVRGGQDEATKGSGPVAIEGVGTDARLLRGGYGRLTPAAGRWRVCVANGKETG